MPPEDLHAGHLLSLLWSCLFWTFFLVTYFVQNKTKTETANDGVDYRMAAQGTLMTVHSLKDCFPSFTEQMASTDEAGNVMNMPK